MSVIARQSPIEKEPIGTRGRITLENQVLRIFGSVEDKITYEYSVSYQDSFNGTIAHFAECLRDGKPFLTSAEDNLKTLQLVEDTYRAANARGHPAIPPLLSASDGLPTQL